MQQLIDEMNQNNETLLDRFFDRSIGKEEKSLLDNQITTDTELAEELLFRKKVGEAFQSAEAKKMKNILQEEESRFQKTMKVSWANPQRLMAMAAIFVGLAAAVWFFQTTKQPDGAAIFAKNFEVENLNNDLFLKNAGFRGAEDSGDARGEKTSPADSVFVQNIRPALEKYEAKNYPAAISELEKLQPTEPKHLSVVQFYLGVCFNKQNQFDDAIENLTKVAARKDKYESPALWHLAMAQFGKGKIEDGKTTLQKYLDSPDGGFYEDQAKAILGKN